MERSVVAVDEDGILIGSLRPDRLAGWEAADDDVIYRTAGGVFIGLGLLRAEQLGRVRFEIRNEEAPAHL